MKIISLALFIFLCSITNLFSQKLTTIQTSFTRTTQKNGKVDIIKGHLYYDGNRTILNIIEPIAQWMILQGTEMLIYYPVEKRAMRFVSDVPSSLPFFHNFIGVVKEEFGLPLPEYSIEDNKVVGDTLFTTWAPDKKLKKAAGEVKVALVADKIVLTESKDPDGHVKLKTRYKDHLEYRGTHFPRYIKIYHYHENEVVIEEVNYSNLIFDQPLPEMVIYFKIPDNIEIEEMTW